MGPRSHHRTHSLEMSASGNGNELGPVNSSEHDGWGCAPPGIVGGVDSGTGG